MSLAIQVKANGVPVRGLFKKVTTEGDIYRFVTAETGHSEVINKGDTRPGKVTPTSNYHDFSLQFRYLVGLHQLSVGIVNAGVGHVTPILDQSVIEAARTAGGWPTPGDLDPASASMQYFAEIDEGTVRVYNLGANDKTLVFSVPHTSLQAVSRSRIMVSKQGDNAIIEGLGNGDGILLRSRGGIKGLLVIDDERGLAILPR